MSADRKGAAAFLDPPWIVDLFRLRRSYRQPTNSGSSFSIWPKAYRTCAARRGPLCSGCYLFLDGRVRFRSQASRTRDCNYDPQRHRSHIKLFGQDEGAVCLPCGRRPLYLGYPDQALTRGSEALTLAQQLSHPASLAYVRYWLAFLYHQLREVQKTQQWTNASILD